MGRISCVFAVCYPDSWQAIGALTSQRWGLRWRTFEPAAPQGSVQGAVGAVQISGGEVWQRCCAVWVLFRLRWRSLAKVLRRVLRRVLSKQRWRSLAKVLRRCAVQGAVGAVPTAVAKSSKGAAQDAGQGSVQTAVAKFG